MRAFQDAGHIGVLIVGDYTTRIGDPVGPLGRAADPLGRGDRRERAALRRPGAADPRPRRAPRCGSTASGSSKLDFADVVRLTRTLTVAQLLERDDFSKRVAAGQPVSVSELLYPLMQAYDSVAVEADVELGGTDQLYNLLAGRTVMEAYGLEPQVVLTTPLLVSWDGTKMSSSVGNNIPLTAAPEEQFGRTMRHPDTMLADWYGSSSRRRCPKASAMDAKLALARFIVARSHGDEAAIAAEAHFTRVVREGGAPEDVPEAALPDGDPVHLPALLAAAFGLSTSEARRMIAQGGVKVERRRRHRARPAARRRSRARSCRRESAGSCASPPTLRVDTSPPDPATIYEPPVREAAEAPCHSTPERPSNESDTTSYRISVGLWRESARSFCCSTRPASIFENSTAYVKRRGPSSTFRRGRGVTPSVRSRTRRFSRRCRTET